MTRPHKATDDAHPTMTLHYNHIFEEATQTLSKLSTIQRENPLLGIMCHNMQETYTGKC